jgi:predicted DNA-binding transcriptional regulator AlpA
MDSVRKANPDKRYATSAQLRARYGGRSEMWLDRLMQRDATFPRPIKIGRFRYWDLDAIEAYEKVAVSRREVA